MFLQVFHVCESGKRQSSFLCPKGTIFNQKHRVCDWWYNVKCEESPEFYDLNLVLVISSFSLDAMTVKNSFICLFLNTLASNKIKSAS